MTTVKLNAYYPGTCAACGGTYAAGDPIEYAAGNDPRHAACATPEALERTPWVPERVRRVLDDPAYLDDGDDAERLSRSR